MLAPGYTADPADELPSGENATALAWLAQQAVADDRFASNTVRTVFGGFTRIDESAPETTGFVTQLKDDFVASGFNMKSLVKAIVLSDYFLARNLDPMENPASYRDYGTARLVTPEELHRAISAVVSAGYEWQGPNTNSSLMEQHRLLYGGIDSDDVTVRTTSPNSLMIGLQRRVARQVSCENTAADLINGGALFPIAGITDTPDGGAAEARIRENIQFLHRHLVGEDLALADAEIDATMQLFLDVRAENNTAIPSDCRGGGGSTDDNGTVLPWMAVVTYLLSDFGFVLPLRGQEMKTMKRRQFMKLSAAAGTGLLSGVNIGWAQQAYPGPYWLFIEANGGWDPTSFCDPKGRGLGPNGDINNYDQGDIGQAGNVAYAPPPDSFLPGQPNFINGLFSNQQFFDAHFQRLLVINGISYGTNSHSVGRTTAWSGTKTLDYPSLGALIANQSAPDLPLPFVASRSGEATKTKGVVPSTVVSGERSQCDSGDCVS